jgi:hypothetical protein
MIGKPFAQCVVPHRGIDQQECRHDISNSFWTDSLPRMCPLRQCSGTKPSNAPSVQDPELRSELLRRMKAEQDTRAEWQRLGFDASAREKPEVKAVLERMEQIDKDNLAWLKEVVQSKGWPTKSMVGKDGALGAFLIAQHAVSDLEFMNTCLGHLKKAHKTGDAEGQWVALMTDRLLVMREKKKQLYGTQLTLKDGKLVPQPIEDEENVDARRKEMGMSPLADYLKMVNERQQSPVKPNDK